MTAPLYSTVLLLAMEREAKLAGKLLPLPIFKVAPAASVNAPPKALRFAVFVERSSTPAATFRSPLIAKLAPTVATPEGLLTVR